MANRKVSFTIPEPPKDATPQMRQMLLAMKEAVEVRLGRRGDPMEQGLTRRDLVEIGVARLGAGGASGPLYPVAGAEPAEARIIPPVPGAFQVEGLFGGIMLSWDNPFELYNVHAFTEIWRSETPEAEDRVLISSSRGSLYFDRITSVEAQAYYYWVRFVSEYNREGPFSLPVRGEKLPDVEEVLTLLSGKLDESSLSQSLNARIRLIDAGASTPGSVAAQIAGEAASRLASVSSLRADIAAERSARFADMAAQKSYTDARVLAERQARANDMEAIASMIEGLEANIGGDYTAGMLVEKQARISADEALASDIQSLTAYAQGVAADVSSESMARAEADEALAGEITALYALNGDLEAELTTESLARAAGDGALVAIQQVMNAVTRVSSAAMAVSSEVYVTEHEASVAYAEQLRADLNASNATVSDAVKMWVDGGSAVATRVSSLEAAVGDVAASVTEEQNARVTATESLAERINTVMTRSGTGGNLVENPEFSVDTSGWAFSTSHSGTFGRNLGVDWTVPPGTGYLAQPNATASGWSIAQQDIPVEAGKTYQFSVYTGAHRCVGYANIQFFNSAGTQLSSHGAVTNSAEAAGGKILSEYKRLVTSAVAPAGASFARIRVYKGHTTSGSNSYLFFTNCMFCEVSSVDTSAVPYSRGPQQSYAAVQQSMQTINGLSAQYTLKLDVNGYVSGFGAYNSGTSADFAVLADRFWIAKPNSASGAVKPFVVDNGVVYMNAAVIKDASIQSAKIGSVTFGKVVDGSGQPVTTASGLLKADKIDVGSLKVTDANISGVIKSTKTNSAGQPRWMLDKAGGMVLNGSGVGGRMEIRDNVIKVFDSDGRLRVHIGDLSA